MEPMEGYENGKKGKRERRILAILRAAEKQFGEKGIENTTMQDIADEANLGVATVFRFFQKKDRIVVAVATKKLERLRKILLPRI